MGYHMGVLSTGTCDLVEISISLAPGNRTTANVEPCPIDWLFAACLEYFFFSIDSSEARKRYDE